MSIMTDTRVIEDGPAFSGQEGGTWSLKEL